MLLEVTLAKDNTEFGPAGSKVMISDSYLVAVDRDNNTGKAIFYVNLRTGSPFEKLHTTSMYEDWYMLRLNV